MTEDNNDTGAARFRAVTEAYGADPARWPEEDREIMAAFQARRPKEAAQFLEAARRLDAELDKAGELPPTEALRRRVLARLEAERESDEETRLAKAGFKARA
jgi:hypothetical protein